MEKQVKRILNKLYTNTNRYYGEKQEPFYSEKILSEKEQAVLSEHKWITNKIEFFAGHGEALEKLLSLKQNLLLDEAQIVRLFIAGVGGSYLRGRSALSSWHCSNTIPLHAYQERPEYACCWICGKQDKAVIINDSEFQYIMHLGNAYADSPQYAYLNLKYLSEQTAISPTLEDIKIFSRLLELLRTAPVDETPGKCEKRLREAKFLPAAQHIRGILHTLAMVGVIPNQLIPLGNDSWVNWGEIVSCEKQLKNTRGRSDLVMPWAGWHGALKINEERAHELFGEYLKTGAV